MSKFVNFWVAHIWGRFCRIFGRISLNVGPAGSYPGLLGVLGSGPINLNE
ncbi:hypothetical protein RchiOBHm_Chr7g0220901 [Rosa chinensis]|uniref:Uncharacterized protein n=1 Tax=Rosa chinensis TaxID=74649 RepID=A0A2P6PCW9_ROSCH|nr:hypothetical protein RchiOBHm_Chr7g0220901 [Rosa chinensis]